MMSVTVPSVVKLVGLQTMFIRVVYSQPQRSKVTRVKEVAWRILAPGKQLLILISRTGTRRPK
jgi:hypothetical protein